MLSVGAYKVKKIKVLALISEYLAAVLLSALVLSCFASLSINLWDTTHISTSHSVLIIILIIEAINFFLKSAVQFSMVLLDSLWRQASRRFWAELASYLGVFLSLQG